MKIAVVIRQVPDLIEPLEVDSTGKALDLSSAAFVLNESDDHALEQALLLKEKHGGSVTVLGIDFGDVDSSLYAAAAKGADQIIKLLWGDPNRTPPPQQAAPMYAEVLRPLGPDLVLVGVQAHDELDGVLPAELAVCLGWPYVGVVRGVQAANGKSLLVCKEFPGAVMAQFEVRLPAVLGILGAEQPPRYVPVSRIRAAMKTASIAEQQVAVPPEAVRVEVARLYPPAPTERAEMLTGSPEEVASRIAALLEEKGLLR
ncbi:MAG: hypothetical protein NZ602_15525 [Thermoguttaceae bacterium]|nr:hypothetical protein [Thermoguttaceae bacterium]MDW8039510.1 hypothetical protein [Thermoguttaceae bacterium]